MTLFEELKWRGLIKDQAGEDLERIINERNATFYWGTDPTADSLHIGHYSSLVTAKRLAKAGHHPILLVGGATGLIGDPRPTAEREIISYEKVEKNLNGIKKQVEEIFTGLDVEVVNNYDWTKDMSILDFLRDIGKYINVNYMLNKDIISRRLETGITFAEFTYTLLQGYDFLYLYEHKNCIMQVEGSDQWGNITTGIELINKKIGKNAYAFTMPLILDSNGEKFGKSAGNALWLDKNKTSSYELYQYLINSSDDKVEEYLKVFTFLTPDMIIDIMEKHKEMPELRLAQKTLASEFIKDLRGEEELNKCIHISEALFKGNIKDLTKEELEMAINSLQSYEISDDKNIVDLLVEAEICSSKREAREFINNNSISINGEKINDLEYIISKSNALYNEYTVVRKGKKKYFVIRHC
ncbi:MAG: tyrosine--tRNA ligase [Bacilli bacterium]|nr:tyrosine--tRNA ligase [Bacilli bacterium]